MRDDRLPTLTTSQLSSGLRDLAGSSGPDYHDDIHRRVARTRQRPGWTFIERWLPMPITMRLAVVPRALVILLLLLGLTLAMVAALATVGGPPSPLRSAALPPLAGLAANGLIAYDSAGDIWVASADGSDPRVLIGGPGIDSSPVWSPDGTRLAYWTQEERGSPSSLMVARDDGSDPVTVASDPAGGVPWRMGWSPDGTALAYSRCPDPVDCRERIVVAAADGSGATEVGDPDVMAARPDWSPDGTLLAFQGSTATELPGAYVMAADGTGLRRLTQLPDGDDYNAFVVDWAPDGNGIVTQGGTPAAVWVASTVDESARQLATGGITWWSPDGEWIAFMKDMSLLALVSADGTETRELAISGAPVWSPDARRLLVGTGPSLVILDTVSGERLATIDGLEQSYPAQAHYPSWQRVVP